MASSMSGFANLHLPGVCLRRYGRAGWLVVGQVSCWFESGTKTERLKWFIRSSVALIYLLSSGQQDALAAKFPFCDSLFIVFPFSIIAGSF